MGLTSIRVELINPRKIQEGADIPHSQIMNPGTVDKAQITSAGRNGIRTCSNHFQMIRNI
jgi:hypothetical protein